MTSTDIINLKASEYFLVLEDEAASADAIAAALAWIESAPEHQAALAKVERFWQACGNAQLHPFETVSVAPGSKGPAHRMAAVWLAGFAAVSALALSLIRPWPATQEPPALRFTTAVGETRLISLPDSSQIRLAGASMVSVAYGPDSRRISLAQGEAMFFVAHDARRPFLVYSGAGVTRAVGTAFDVNRTLNATVVTVVKGLVEIETGSGRDPVPLGRDMQVSYSTEGRIGIPRAVNTSRAVAWQRGVLQFVDAPLGSIVMELNRYSPRPITIDSPDVAALPITGSVRVNAIEDWLSGLESATGVRIVPATDDNVHLNAGTRWQQKKNTRAFPS
ncbi:hypothetical protein HL653_10850 [Sphingomonas sp. AP4-R1]|uniref:FecR family protein n=1 Tax=Sphingomonas sp. AP4-R1 TaxID=2735134 RepID=UPI00149391C0|nr:FecR domain-containing protein [Sphingomonas sp. AP4-R1]QJU58222.1 hypothetical protein HL653_10850 [Sphingomonas sp. AP4-R1]